MLISVPEAREILRIEGEDNDPIIVPLIEAIPDYLEVTTGRRWDKDTVVNPLAKTTAGFILQLWFESQDYNTDKLKRTIDSLLAALTAIGRSIE